MMRKMIPGLTVTIIFFVLAGCHKDDNNSITIQGKWFLQNTRIRQYNNDILQNDTTYAFTSSSYEFTNDGTYIYNDEDGDTLHFTYTYDDNAKKLVTSEGGDLYEYKVTKLTASELVLYEADSATNGTDTHKLTYDISLHR